MNQKAKRKNNQPNKDGLHRLRLAGYGTWSDEKFKERMRINCETFNFILERTAQLIHEKPTHMVPNPILDGLIKWRMDGLSKL